MATIVMEKKTGKKFVLIDTVYNRFTGVLMVCNKAGSIVFFDTKHVKVISIDNMTPAKHLK